MYTRLLQRQLNKCLGEGFLLTPDLKRLLDVINRSYEHYERDNFLSKQSLEISSSELGQLADELSERESFTRAILEAASDGILVINEQERVEVCNALATKYLGIKEKKEILGKQISSWISLPGTVGLYELDIKHKDQGILPLEITVSQMQINQKNLSIYVLRDISVRKENEKKMEAARERENELQKKLVESARRAGMMEVATSVLHNVGNVLNTVNISTTLLKEQTLLSPMGGLPKIADLLAAHTHDLPFFLTEDPKGKLLPEFITALAKKWQEEHAQTIKELEILEKNILHIKNIIKMQQSMSGLMGIKEKLCINVLLDDILSMHLKELQAKNIQISKEYAEIPEISVDRGRLLQILVNILRNAIEAMKSKKEGEKKLILRTSLSSGANLLIEISDNGVGIDKDHLLKIFTYGFSTKEGGHGFGLHNSALLAKELGGAITARSEGVGKGASFFLTLPLENHKDDACQAL